MGKRKSNPLPCDAGYEPNGLRFTCRATGRRMKFVDASEPRRDIVGWLVYFDEATQLWTPDRKAEDADIFKLC